MAIGISGLTADARVLADYMRNEHLGRSCLIGSLFGFESECLFLLTAHCLCLASRDSVDMSWVYIYANLGRILVFRQTCLCIIPCTVIPNKHFEGGI